VKLPKLWRRKNAAGKFIGNYFISRDGDINLGTSDANEATKRRLEAVQRGKRNFVDEVDEAADAIEGIEPGEGSPESTPAGGSTPPPAPAAAPPLQPDAVIPPRPPQLALPPAPATDAAAEAQATNEAADEVDDQAHDAGAGGAAAPGFPPNVLDGFLEQGASVIVDLQLELQAAVIRKRFKRAPERIPDDSPVRKMAAEAWVAQLKIWFPADTMLPPWAMALLLPIMCVPQQLANATPIKDEEPQPQDASGVEAEKAAA